VLHQDPKDTYFLWQSIHDHFAASPSILEDKIESLDDDEKSQWSRGLEEGALTVKGALVTRAFSPLAVFA
jgi:hypothetical protein